MASKSNFRYKILLSNQVPDQTKLLDKDQESRQQPLWHLIVLNILTCSTYSLYWFYKTWRDLAAQAETPQGLEEPKLDQFRKISPMLRTIGIFIPIWHLWLAFHLFSGIAKLYPESNTLPSRHPNYTAAAVLALVFAVLQLGHLPEPYHVLAFTAAVPLAIVQGWLNDYWKSIEPADLIVRHAFTGKELIALVAGSVLFALNLAPLYLSK
jgi:hypothetical protein